mgnify:CR=1 FL=1
MGIDSIRVSNLALDDVAVSQARLSEYTAVPFEQAGTYFPSLVVTNQGINNASGVNVSYLYYYSHNGDYINFQNIHKFQLKKLILHDLDHQD